MANTSGTINSVSFTATEIITDALQDLKVLLDDAAPQAQDISKGVRKLNFWVKRIAIEGVYLWCKDTIPVPLVTNIFRYTIGPGGDVDTYRPLRALPDGYIRQTCGSTPAPDVQMNLLSRMEYFQMSQKGALGTPNSYYLDEQMAPSPFSAYDPTLSKAVLYVWTAPSDLTRTFFMDVHRPIQDITADTTFDMPMEWYDCISKNLAAELSNAYETPTDFRRELKAEARESLNAMANYGAQEQAPLQFQPDWRWATSMRMR